MRQELIAIYNSERDEWIITDSNNKFISFFPLIEDVRDFALMGNYAIRIKIGKMEEKFNY